MLGTVACYFVMPHALKRKKLMLEEISHLKQQNSLLSQRLDQLEEWKTNLYSIYKIEDVLKQHAFLGRWDTFIEFLPPEQRIHKCLVNLTKWPMDIVHLVEHYCL